MTKSSEEMLYPCPFCGSTDLVEEYAPLVGCRHESQNGYVECNNCGANGAWVEAVDGQIYDGTFNKRVQAAWNKAHKGGDEYQKAYRAGWNDALQELLMEIEEEFTYKDLKQMVKYMTKP